ncbi:MAG: hypothetical protein IPL96_02955 [Holophagaceae bacterium]|nr:hypothetical protein [Holophagaceae bacterium]
MRAILPDPADANTVYVLTAGGGLWKTSNFQDTPPTWRSLTDQVGSTRGGSAAFGKSKSGAGAVLHVGLGDPFDMGVGGFMVRSLDAGQTWSTPIQLSGTITAITYTATQVLDVKVDDTAATEATTTVLVGTDKGLFRSTDGGASFAIVDNASFNGKRVWSLARVGPLTWLAAAEDTSSGTGVIMRSTTGGATWFAASPIAGGRMTLSNVPGEATVYCFAAAAGDAAQLDLYKSTTGGTTAWTATNTTSGSAPATTNTDQNNNNYMHANGYYDQMLLVDPQDGTRNTLYIGGDLSSAKNTNGGATGGTAATKWNLQTNWFGKFSLPYAHGGFQCAAKLDLGATHRVFLGPMAASSTPMMAARPGTTPRTLASSPTWCGPWPRGPSLPVPPIASSWAPRTTPPSSAWVQRPCSTRRAPARPLAPSATTMVSASAGARPRTPTPSVPWATTTSTAAPRTRLTTPRNGQRSRAA